MCTMQFVLASVALYVGMAHSWDIALTNGDLLEFYTNATKTVSVRFNSQNLAALTYDEVHNMILYVDKQSDNDAICGFDMSSMQYKYLTERNGRNIHGLAFDPATELLFFTDTNERSINWISLKAGSKNNVNGNVLIKMDDGIPTDIAVDSCRGYIYWINTNLTTPTIERARFNGSERAIVIESRSRHFNTTYDSEPHSLVIDQQTKKIYWYEPYIRRNYNLQSADLNGESKKRVNGYLFLDYFPNPPNTLAVSKISLYVVGWGSTYTVTNLTKTSFELLHREKTQFMVNTEITSRAVTAHYTISEQIQGIQDCEALTSLVRNNSVANTPLKTTKENDGPFCVHGLKVNGQSLCKCSPGYTGERCDVSVCENYCSQGVCSFNDEGLPTCRCNAGYSGDRCEVDACYGYCLNNGDCSLNDKSEPVCQCKGDYGGDRCDVSECLNYCFQGNCSINDGLPTCRCNANYAGERCEINACFGYCLNNGDCSLNEEDEPFCHCIGHHEGSRCEAVKNDSLANTTNYSSVGRNLSLADIFTNWRKPISKITVIVESS